MLEILGLLKRWLLNVLGLKKSRISTSLLLKLILIYFKKPLTAGSIHDGRWLIKYNDARSFFNSYFEIFVREVYQIEFKHQRPRILDVGSNIGLSMLYLKERYPESHIIAIEADPAICTLLQENISQNGLSQVTLHNKAAWISEGNIAFQTDNSDGGAIALEAGKHSQMVPTLSLPDLLHSNTFDFIKIDIEGAENELFPAIKDLLIKCPKVFIEYHSQRNRPQNLGLILNHFAHHGFRYTLVSLANNWNPFTANHSHKDFDGQYNLWFKKDL